MIYDLVVVGGGAAGFFGAINTALENPNYKILIVEKSSKVLQKVKISGGGRCNVTNQIAEPTELIKNYPRGGNELLAAFNKFTSTDTVRWFKKQGVELKIEKDGRIFPVSDNSDTIIQCFLNLCKVLKIEIKTNFDVKKLTSNESDWEIEIKNEAKLSARKVLVTTGSSPNFIDVLDKKGIIIVNAVPSLFTFTIETDLMKELAGNSFPNAEVSIVGCPEYKQKGPLLITHWGFSGPSILKLSSQAALLLNKINYTFEIEINWLGKNSEEVTHQLKNVQLEFPKKQVTSYNALDVSSKFWKKICEISEINSFQNWAETGKKHFKEITKNLTKQRFKVVGKSTFKDEFVTAGGVNLNDVILQTFEHKTFKNLYFAGEVLNIDAYTGGFNFQSAWTTSWIVSKNI